MSERHKEKTYGVFQCMYRGFIHTDSPDGQAVPGQAAVQKAYSMLSKKRIKKTRKLHPLFGRGFDTPLKLMVQSGAVRVDLPGEQGQKGAVVMNTLLHKVAFVGQVVKAVGIIVKRPGTGKFKCHLFLLDDEATAKDVTSVLQKAANDAFRRLHRVSCRLRKQRIEQGPPALATRKPSLADDEQPWFHGPLSRSHAEDILRDFAAIDGLFLVRQREGKPNEFVISFLVGGMVFHNRVTRLKDGQYQNSKGTVFPSLRIMIAEYQNKHPDMQCILTEYVPRDRVEGGVEYANAAVLNAARQQQQKATFSRWSETDVRQVLQSLDEDGDKYDAGPDGDVPTTDAETGALTVDDLVQDGGSSFKFDPIFDDVRFGFGNEFVSLVMNGNTDIVQPEDGVDLDSDCFDLTDMMTHLDREDEC